MNAPVGYKLLVSYDAIPERINEYRQFILSKYIPQLQANGLQIREAWHTAYGDAPNRLLEFVSRDLDAIQTFMESDLWEELNEELTEYATEIGFKVVEFKDQFQT